jgi:hypothetical protein
MGGSELLFRKMKLEGHFAGRNSYGVEVIVTLVHDRPSLKPLLLKMLVSRMVKLTAVCLLIDRERSHGKQ